MAAVAGGDVILGGWAHKCIIRHPSMLHAAVTASAHHIHDTRYSNGPAVPPRIDSHTYPHCFSSAVCNKKQKYARMTDEKALSHSLEYSGR